MNAACTVIQAPADPVRYDAIPTKDLATTCGSWEATSA
jgi:hypothetical protein